jgi:hypothetical protein
MAEDTGFDFNPSEVEQQAPSISDFTSQQQGVNIQTPESDFSKDMFSSIDEYSKAANVNFNNNTTGVSYIDPGQISRFTAQESYDPFSGVSITDPNATQRMIDAEDWGSAMGKALDGFAYNFGNTFTDYWHSYGRMADAIVSMDWDKLRPDEETLIDQYYNDQKNMDKNFVYVNPEDEDSIFSKKFVADTVSNAGFALGTFAGIGIELAADALITVASGGAGGVSFLATAARILPKFGAKKVAQEAAEAGVKSGFRFGEMVSDFAKGYTSADKTIDEISAFGKTANKIDEVSEAAKLTKSPSAKNATINETFIGQEVPIEQMMKSASFGEKIGKVIDYVPLAGSAFRYGEKIAAASKAGAGIAQLTGMGVKGGYRIAQELNLASTEASFEAVSTYGDTLDRMVREHKAKNGGENPTPEEFQMMQEQASKAAGANYNTNIAILLGSNKIQFGNLFNKFSPANKFARELLEESSERLLVVEGKTFNKVYQKGITGAYGQLGKIAKDFGKREALYQGGKAFAKDALRFEVTEGIQENMQEASASAWKDYYANKYAGIETSLGEVFGQGISDQFTKQGFKTFMMGAITGSVVRMPTALASRSLEKLQDKAISAGYKNDVANDPVKQAQKQFEEGINTLNNFMKKAGEKSFDASTERMLNFAEQVSAAQGMTSAASQGKRYEFENHRDNAMMSAIRAAKSLGTIDVLQRSIQNMTSKMTNEEFEKSFGIKLEDTKYNSVQEFGQSLSRDVKKYSDVHDGIRRKVGSMIDPLMYKEGSKNRYTATMIRMQQEEIAHVIASNAIKGDMTVERSKQVASELRSNPIIGASSDFALRVLSKGSNVISEIGNLSSEVEQIKQNLKNSDGLEPETIQQYKDQIESKEKEIKLLQDWTNQFDTVEEEVDVKDSEGNITKEKRKVIGKFKGSYVKGQPKIDDADADPQMNMDTLNLLTEYFNIKNKQAGLDIEPITVTQFKEHYDKIIDYIRLEDDIKVYMNNVDLMFNPEQFTNMVERMTDGNFKYKIFQYLEYLPNQVISSVFETARLLEITSMQELTEITNAIKERLVNSTPYKNLMVIAVDPNAGIENSEYVEKQLEEIARVLSEALMDEIQNRSGIENYQDIDDADFADFEVSGNISYKYLYEIAKKSIANIPLSEREQKVNDEYLESIQEIIKRISGLTTPQQPPQTPPAANAPTPSATPTPQPGGTTVQRPGNQALRDTMMNQLRTIYSVIDGYTVTGATTFEEKADLIIDDIIINLIKTINSPVPADASVVTDVMSDPSGPVLALTNYVLSKQRSLFWNIYRTAETEFINGTLDGGAQASPVNPVNPGATASGTSTVTGNDLKISGLKAGDIIDNRDPNGAPLEVKSIDIPNRTVTFTFLGVDDVKTFEEVAADYQVEIDIPITPVPGTPGGPTPTPVPSYTVEGDAVTKFSVLDPAGTVMFGGIDTQERADALAESLNNSLNDIQFVRDTFFDTEDPNIISEFIARGYKELNKEAVLQQTIIPNLEAFYKMGRGRRKLNEIRDNIEKELDVDQDGTKAPDPVAVNPTSAPDSVDNSTSIITPDAIINDASFNDIMNIANESKQESQNISNFVGGVDPNVPTKESLIDFLKNSINCNS